MNNNQPKDDAKNYFENVANKEIKPSESESDPLGHKECFCANIAIGESINSNTCSQISATSLDIVTDSDCTHKDIQDHNESNLSASAAVFDMPITPPSFPSNCLKGQCTKINNDDDQKDKENDCPNMSPGDEYAEGLIRSMITENFEVDKDDKIITPAGHKLSTDLHNIFEMIAKHYARFEDT